MKGDGASVARDARSEFDLLCEWAWQRLVGHGLWQVDLGQEGGIVVSQRMTLQPHLVVVGPPARPPLPVDEVLALRDA